MSKDKKQELAKTSSSSSKVTPPPKKKKPKSWYFPKETDDYIELYLNTESTHEKNQIFEKHLYYPFYKLAENLIHNWKFYYTDVDDLEHLKHELVIFFLDKFPKYKPSRGKAFSYFTIAGRRWLIIYNQKNYEILKQKSKIDEADLDFLFINDKENQEKTKNLIIFFEHFINFLDENLESIYHKPQELKVAGAFITIFRNRLKLEIIQKKALWVYIREIAGLEQKDTPIITKVVNSMKILFKNLFKEYELYGELPKDLDLQYLLVNRDY